MWLCQTRKLWTVSLLALLLLGGCSRFREGPSPTSQPTEPVPTETVVSLKEKTAGPFTHFVHVSDLYEEGVSEGYARPYAIIAWAKNGTLVSVDENADEDQLQVLFDGLEEKEIEIGYSLYLEGPGGPTGDDGKFGGGELYRIAKRAREFCQAPIVDQDGRRLLNEDGSEVAGIKYDEYSVDDIDGLDWMREWNTTGWPEEFGKNTLPKLRGTKPFQDGHQRAFVSTEIDNLERHLESSGKTFGQFLTEFESWTQGEVKLILKNLHYDDETFVKVEGVLNHPNPELFVGFYIAEIAPQERETIEPEVDTIGQQLAPLGIKTLKSYNTYRYMASTDESLISNLSDETYLEEIEQGGVAVRPTPSPLE